MSTTEKELAYPSSADRLASVSKQPPKKRQKKELCILENPVFLSFCVSIHILIPRYHITKPKSHGIVLLTCTLRSLTA